MPFTRRVTRGAGLLAAAGAVAASALALAAGPAAVHSEPARKASYDLNEIDRLISRATITSSGLRGKSFNISVTSAQYEVSFLVQLENGRVPHRASMFINIKQSDGIIMMASPSQEGPGRDIQFGSLEGYSGALARRDDVRAEFPRVFAEGRRVAGLLFGRTTGEPGERITFSPTEAEIRGFARQLLAAAYLANPSHPDHLRQVSEFQPKR